MNGGYTERRRLQGQVKVRYLALSVILNYAFSAVTISPEISLSTFSIPLQIQLDVHNFTIQHQNNFYHLDHPLDRYLWSNNSRNDITAITEYSFIQGSWINSQIEFSLGRKYLQSGPGKFNGVFLSPVSPSVDNIQIKCKSPNSTWKFEYTLIKLDNRISNWDNSDHYINRWFYHRRINFRFSDNFNFSLIDAVMSTGENRGIEWYYFTPFAVFQAEQLHEISRTDGITGSGNNDNGMLGFDWEYTIKPELTIYNELLIDDFQIDSEDRDSMQTVFGIVLGCNYQFNKLEVNFEYSYASPWMYLNRGIFTSPERYSLPLGLRYPHSQSIDLGLYYSIKTGENLYLELRFEQSGNQTIETEWDAWQNKIGYFNFTDHPPIAFNIGYNNENGNWINTIQFKKNWLAQDGYYFLVGKKVNIF